ncbi:hypothetical protein LNQ81_13505 [Myroides sp. M-43]|uniref:hypothetical protein n=1 Tax=Myroides oncorhynchi TaxID=2893756 RepID=UPI001E45A171|nr:hypothetical protein [Myroides oncorhynchi]MCC9043689.1 hypothetical protein [Myroides oncorhynchi]
MRNTLVVLSLFLGLNLSAQSTEAPLEKSEKWVNYTTVIEKKVYANKGKWTKEYTLKEGKVESYKAFYKEDLRTNVVITYDEYGNIDSNIVSDETKKPQKVHTLNFDLKYNSEGLKVEDTASLYTYNANNLVETKYSKKWETSNQKEGWFTKYEYDTLGNITRKEKTTIRKGEPQLDIEELTYDQYNNVLTISRSSSPTRKYPIIMIGGRSLHQHETFEYKYNDDHLWTAKYLIASDNKKILLAEREMK